MSQTKIDKSLFKGTFFWIFLILIVVIVNILVFSLWNSNDKIPKISNVGNTVVLEYAKKGESYYIDGIENGNFSYNDGIHTFYSKDYLVRKDADPYKIMDSSGNQVGTVYLKPDTKEYSTYNLDLSKLNSTLVKVPNSYEALYVYSSEENMEHCVSIQLEERTSPIEVTFNNVSIKAPPLSPVIYSVSDADIEIEIIGNVTLVGGDNPFTHADVSSKDRFLSMVDTAANAYCVCMISAIGTAASIVHGVDYYMDMFAGVSSLQLAVMENAWNKVEDFFNGTDGAPGLDGVSAVQIAGRLNIVGSSDASLKLVGGNGSRGGNGSSSFMTTTKGGKGGNGGSAIVCGTLATNLGTKISYTSGNGGEGGDGGTSVTGTGSRGNRGGQNEAKVIINQEIIFP